MRARLSKLSRPYLTFFVCVAIAYGMWVYEWAVSSGVELPSVVEWVIGDDIKDPKYKVDAELQQYLDSFVALAKLKGIDLSYIYEQDIHITFTDNERDSRVATSFKRDKNGIAIMVHRGRFASRTEEGRKYVMFHELGHDVLDFPHLEGNERGMMEPTAYTGFFRSYERFSQERQQNYLYRSLNTMFDRWNQKQ